ncbi:MAG: uroporphyrinogen-III C-methyltransferase [Betaproteobacteria bacterium]|nr:uroporphyrinogen-III C-methyltransferase [Betaproteobacteria bacterium]
MGRVYLVGAGPGAPDLLTLRAARLLAAADIVLHDALVHPDTLALATRAELVPVGKRCGAHSTAQRFINKRLVDAAKKHAVVVRLKGGDPMLFGRAQEEVAALVAAGIAYEVVPGITAATAAGAQIGASLTQRGVARSVAFVTPRIGDEETGSDWAAAALAADTAAIYMGAGQAAAIARTLIARGRAADTPVVVVRDASLPGSTTRTGMLRDLAALCAADGAGDAHGARSAVAGPAMILLGEALREACAAGAPGLGDDRDFTQPLRLRGTR